MNITKRRLQQIINEELQQVVSEKIGEKAEKDAGATEAKFLEILATATELKTSGVKNPLRQAFSDAYNADEARYIAAGADKAQFRALGKEYGEMANRYTTQTAGATGARKPFLGVFGGKRYKAAEDRAEADIGLGKVGSSKINPAAAFKQAAADAARRVQRGSSAKFKGAEYVADPVPKIQTGQRLTDNPVQLGIDAFQSAEYVPPPVEEPKADSENP